MSKIIVENRSELSDINALDLVRRVMTGGRISNAGKQYCYATVFTVEESGIQYSVFTDINKKSDRFVVSLETKTVNLEREA